MPCIFFALDRFNSSSFGWISKKVEVSIFTFTRTILMIASGRDWAENVAVKVTTGDYVFFRSNCFVQPNEP